MSVSAGEDEDQFEQFMLPLTAAFEAVAQMLSTNTFNEQEAKVRTPSQTYRHINSISFVKHLFLFLQTDTQCVARVCVSVCVRKRMCDTAMAV